MNIIKIVVIALAGTMLAIINKNNKNEYGLLISLTTSLVIFFYVISKIEVVVETVNQLKIYIDINDVYIKSLIKIVGITYISELTSGICKDCGYNTIAGQIEMFSKLSILVISMPVCLTLIKTIETCIA